MKLDKVMSKINKITSKLLTNKMVLNVVAILAFLNIIGYLMIGKLNDVAYFIIIAGLTRYFSKNMIIVLGVPLVIVNLLACRCVVTEGMISNDTNNDNNNDDNNSKQKMAALKLKQNKTNDNSDNSDNSDRNNGNNGNNNNNTNNKDRHLDETTMNNSIVSNMNNNNSQDGFESGKKKHNKYNIDYASTIEDAYDELNNILGSDGIQRLTSDTQKLMNQQIQLAEAMKGMGPMVQSLSPMVEQLKGMMGEGGMQNMMDLAKQFTKPKN